MAISHRRSVLRRITCLVIAAVTLSGCVVVPAPWDPYRPRYSYYR
jgi:hypothetical protein